MATKKGKTKLTPLMEQYFEMKAKHSDAILLFRVGDFYETFGEDAVQASAVLGIVLTSRNNGGSDIELAGFPHHSLETYLPKLVKAGFRVAICDQLEKPSKEKKIVKRGVTDVVTPGVGTSDNLLEQKENNYLAAVYFDNNEAAVAFLDLSTGEYDVYSGQVQEVQKLLGTYHPKEILFDKSQETEFARINGEDFYCYGIEEWVWQLDYCRQKLLDLFKVTTLKAYGIENKESAQIAAGAIIHYLESTEHKKLQHINQIKRIHLDNYVWLDQFTIRNLELLHSNHPSGVSLAEVMDHTSSAMGGRLLKKWILLPLTDKVQIETRLNIVEILYDESLLSDELSTALKNITDLERIVGKIALQKVNPRELDQLKNSLLKCPQIKMLFEEQTSESLFTLLSQLQDLPEVLEKIELHIAPDPPVNLNKGGVIADGCHDELDDWRSLIRDSKKHLQALLDKEIERTSIQNLKVGFNNVFGYYFEVTNKYKNQGLIPEDWTRKQTLTNSERYISQELKDLETKILNAEERILILEQTIYDKLVWELTNYIESIQRNAQVLAQLDCLNSFAKLSRRQNYCKPVLTEGTELVIEEGRHPVIEIHLPLGESYIPNDLHIDSEEDSQILLITGPNMSGKSAILRQTALICLMAQMGCYVPAKSVQMGLVDRVFTRVGASDNISSGESTFMVEMTETATIMNNLSSRSLILLDEIGRGTSTYDGISIAWAIVEYLHEHETRPKTLFATHYHELSELADKYDRVENYAVSTKELGDKILFLRKLVKGASNQSFGIQVALMSGLPKEIILRAGEVLNALQQHSVERDKMKKEELKTMPIHQPGQQLSLFDPDPKLLAIQSKLRGMDVNAMTPIQCMMALHELTKTLEE